MAGFLANISSRSAVHVLRLAHSTSKTLDENSYLFGPSVWCSWSGAMRSDPAKGGKWRLLLAAGADVAVAARGRASAAEQRPQQQQPNERKLVVRADGAPTCSRLRNERLGEDLSCSS